MNWAQIAFGLSDVLSLVLVIRLITLRLHDVYRIFCAFLLFEIVSESFTIIERFSSLDSVVDYRLTWLIMRLVFWVLSIWIVYALLRAIFASLPGILRFSRKTLHVVLPASVLIALATAVPEYIASGAPGAATHLEYAVRMALILERIVATIAVLTLLLTLAFILWFPVTMPRNLAVFSIGFIVYFTAKTALLLIHSFWSHGNIPLVNNGVTFILCICLACWIIFLNKEGEIVPVTIGHGWQPSDRSELLHNLEALNASLARAGRR
jgi:hypothetical protein